MEVTTQSFNELVQKVNEFEIAKGYFSDILSGQTVIFGTIVIIALTLLGVLTWFKSKSFIKKTAINITKNITERHKKELKGEIKEKYEDLTEKLEDKYRVLDEKLEDKYEVLDKKIDAKIEQHDIEIAFAKGEIFRMFGQFWEDKGKHITAFLWWIRAAEEFASKPGGKIGTRISLQSATRTVKKTGPSELKSDYKNEYQKIFSKIDDKIYKKELIELDKAFKEALDRKPEQK